MTPRGKYIRWHLGVVVICAVCIGVMALVNAFVVNLEPAEANEAVLVLEGDSDVGGSIDYLLPARDAAVMQWQLVPRVVHINMETSAVFLLEEAYYLKLMELVGVAQRIADDQHARATILEAQAADLDALVAELEELAAASREEVQP